MTTDANISVSNRAANRIREIMAGGAGQNALRVSVQGGGCSGFRYDFEIVSQTNADDLVIEKSGRAGGDRSGVGSVHGGLGNRFCRRSDRRFLQDHQSERDGVLRLRHILFCLVRCRAHCGHMECEFDQTAGDGLCAMAEARRSGHPLLAGTEVYDGGVSARDF